MLYSMTGFGTATVQLGSEKIVVDIKSLNSKQLDLNCRIPTGLRSVEPALRNLVGGTVERGKLDLIVNIERVDNAVVSHLNLPAIAEYKKQVTEMAQQLGLPEPADWYGVLLRLPEAISTADESTGQNLEEQSEGLFEATKNAISALMEYRRAEGKKLEEFFAIRVDRIRKLLAEVPKYENERIERIKAKLIDSLSKIPNVDYDKGRLEQEMIYYIEKLDVNEEKQRLTQHLDYFLETMNAPAGGQGKKLGFIAQEMTREINTLGSKSNHAEMQNLVIRMKDELEQIKEQVLNVM